MYNHYLANYEYLQTTLTKTLKEYRFNNFDSLEQENTFKNLSHLYNLVILKYLTNNDLISDFMFLFIHLKTIPELKISLADEIIKSEFSFDSEYKKDFEIYAGEEYISEQIGRDFLVIKNYLIKNKIYSYKKTFSLLDSCREKLHQLTEGVKK